MRYMLYPVFEQIIPIYKSLVGSGKDEYKCVAPRSIKDLFEYYKDVYVSFDYDAELKNVESVIICDVNDRTFMYRDIIQKIRKALYSGKFVRCLTKLENSDYEALLRLSDECKAKFTYEYSDPNFRGENFKISQFGRAHTLTKQECIIVGVGDLFGKVGSGISFYKLLSCYRKKGYRTVGISLDNTCKLLDCYSFPDDIFKLGNDYGDKIIEINNYVNNVQMKTNADIIIVHFPGEMMKYSDECVDDFGVKSFILAQALSVDYFVLNAEIGSYTYTSFNEMSTAFMYRFGFCIDAVFVANKEVDISNSLEDEKIHFIRHLWDEVDEYVSYLKNNCSFVYSIYDDNSYTNVVEKCIDELSGNIEEF